MAVSDYLNQSGYRIIRANHELYDGLSAATLTLTGDLPSVDFRCLVTLSSTTGHTDCAGSVVVGSETLTFTAAGKKTSTVGLSVLPAITTSNMDCNILVEAITTGGAPIQQETQVAIVCRFQNTQKSFMNLAGEWTQSQAIAYVSDSAFEIGSIFSYGNYDYQIAQVSAHVDLEGDEVFRKLYLTGRTTAPDDRTAVVPATEYVEAPEYMLKSVYDTDDDGIVDLAEAVI